MSPTELENIFKTLVTASDIATIIKTDLPSAGVLNRKVIAQANPARRGLIIYNNCSNSIYVSYSADVDAASKMTLIIPTFAHWIMSAPIYRGVLSAMKNAGTTGSVIVTELT